jgi:hypothetical protein
MNKLSIYKEFHLTKATSPMKLSKGEDSRSLGLGLAKINFD